MNKFLKKLVCLGIILLTKLSSVKLAFAEEDSEAPSSPESSAGQVGPTGLQDLHGDGIRINNAFKPINAPDAINQNYTTDTVNAFLQFIAGSIIELTAGVAIFVLVIAGYMFVTAGGDQGRIDKAKEIIKYTIFGMLLIILSYVIVKTIISLIIDVDTF